MTLAAEVPAFVCGILRLYSKWMAVDVDGERRKEEGWGVDDWVFVVDMVRPS